MLDWRCAAILFAFYCISTVLAADFPAPDKLPEQEAPPDPLLMLNGERIATREDWVSKRRPELKELFQHYMYGYLPEPPKLDAKVAREDKQYFGGKATKREVDLKLGPDGSGAPTIHLLLIVPNKRTQPAPVFVGLSFCGIHSIVNDPSIPLPKEWMPTSCAGCKNNQATDEGRGKSIDTWNVENTVDRGYGVAIFYCGDIEPDLNGAKDGLRQYLKKNGDKHDVDFLGAVGAWAWGVHRVVDYLVTNEDIDKTKIAVVGHSRLGKAAIVAGAFDERIALVIPLQAGCGGTAPNRGKIGEPVARINKVFPHWFTDTYKEFNEHTERVPFDQHCLMALIAPRPLLISNAVEDTWANPAGQFEMLQAAEPVYKLLGAGGLDAKSMPETGKLIDSTMGYFIRPGKHSMTRVDWDAFLDFADKHFGKPK